MNALQAVTGALLGALLISTRAEAAVVTYGTRGTWEAAVGGPFTETNTFPGIATFTDVGSLTLDGGTTLTFDNQVNKRTIGAGWETWSGGFTGDVFYSNGRTSITADISAIAAFGVELEPDPFRIITMSLTLKDGTALTQDVDGTGGAKFFGWVGAGITSFTMSAATDFAFGRFVQATSEPPPSYAKILADSTTRPGEIEAGGIISSDFNSNQPTLVVTHGWQPPALGAVYAPNDPSQFPLASVVTAIQQMAPDANIVTWNWEDAYTNNPAQSAAKTAAAGTSLAKYLGGLIPDGYTQDLHFVGHSHGTFVNAEAISILSKEYNISQATLLDAPRVENPTTALIPGASVLPGYFYALMPAGSVDYVENFYTDVPLLGYGAPLLGAGPTNSSLSPLHIGQNVPLVTHSTISENFYAALVQSQGWVSPASSNRPEGLFAAWVPVSLRQVADQIPAALGNFADDLWQAIIGTPHQVYEMTYVASQTVSKVFFDSAGRVLGIVGDGLNIIGNVAYDALAGTAQFLTNTFGEIISAGGAITNNLIALFENSPAMVAHKIVIPTDADIMQLEIFVFQGGDGDWLTIHFGEELLYTLNIDDFLHDYLDVFIPISDFSGESGTIFITLNSVGAVNAQFGFGDIKFLYTENDQPSNVPEPNSIWILAIWTLILLLLRDRRLFGRAALKFGSMS